jgi:cyanate lyase
MSDTALPVPVFTTEPSELGPACMKLSARHLRFAFALCNEVSGPDAAMAAAIVAGFPTTNVAKLKTDARKLSHDPSIVAALEELGRQRLSLDLPLALETLRAAMKDKFGKDKIKAAQILLDRILPTKTEVMVVTDKIDTNTSAIAHLKHLRDVLKVGQAALELEFGVEGLLRWSAIEAAQEKAKPLVVDYEVIEPSSPVQAEEEADFTEISLDDELDQLLKD